MSKRTGRPTGRPRVDHSALPCTGCGGKRDRPRSRCVACESKRRLALRRKNPEASRAYLRTYYARNTERCREWARQGYERHRESRIAKAMEWIYANPDRRAAIMRRREEREVANGGRGYTEADWAELVARFNGVCGYCQQQPPHYADHYIPIARGGPDDFANIVPACLRCNQRKGSADPVQWITRVFGEEHMARVRAAMLPDEESL